MIFDYQIIKSEKIGDFEYDLNPIFSHMKKQLKICSAHYMSHHEEEKYSSFRIDNKNNSISPSFYGVLTEENLNGNLNQKANDYTFEKIKIDKNSYSVTKKFKNDICLGNNKTLEDLNDLYTPTFKNDLLFPLNSKNRNFKH